MIFEFKNNTLFLMSSSFRLKQDINTDTNKKFKNIKEAKKWTNKYFGKEILFIDEKIDITNLKIFNQLNILNVVDDDESIDKISLKIHQFDDDKIIYEKDFSINELNEFNINDLKLNLGKYYFSIESSKQLEMFFEKNNVSFVID